MGRRSLRLIDFHTSPELLVLVADELDHLLIHSDSLVDSDGERLRVGLRIVDRDVDLELAEDRPPESLGELRLLAVRAAMYVQPPVERPVFGAAQVVGFHNKVVSFPT